MVRLLGLVLVGAIALPTQASPRANGKVVRIEVTRGTTVIPRVCEMQADKNGMCLGTQPVIGEIVMVLDETGVIAQARINAVKPLAPGVGATCNALWRIETEVVAGDLAAVSLRTMGVVDPELHPRKARMFAPTSLPPAPDGGPNDKVVAAIDRNGDGTPDILLTQGVCEENPGAGGMCVDEWSRVGGRLAKVQHTNFSTCGF